MRARGALWQVGYRNEAGSARRGGRCNAMQRLCERSRSTKTKPSGARAAEHATLRNIPRGERSESAKSNPSGARHGARATPCNGLAKGADRRNQTHPARAAGARGNAGHHPAGRRRKEGEIKAIWRAPRSACKAGQHPGGERRKSKPNQADSNRSKTALASWKCGFAPPARRARLRNEPNAAGGSHRPLDRLACWDRADHHVPPAGALASP